uniref:Uncharacterized protein n=1 Tax=Anopheles merus TaxID=30066 RepID=A0A182UPR2_ANOME
MALATTVPVWEMGRPTVPKTTTRPILVVISCGCCFLQSCIAFAIMLPILYQRRCCVTFLKMQFCSATSMAMAIFILGLLQLFPPHGKLALHGIATFGLNLALAP